MTELKDERAAIDELLPWHATGRLSAAEAARVEAALRADPELARRLDLVRDELDETIRVNERLGAPSPHAIEKLFAKIDAEPKYPLATPGGLASRLSEWLAALAPRTLALAVTAAALALVVQAGIIGSLLIEERPAGFSTASAPTFEPQGGSFVLVGFTETATAAQVLTFLKANEAVIVDGPRAGGLFKLRVSADRLPPEELNKIVQRLGADRTLVRMAAPVH
ncbi:hypothetical protein [Blastochloris sulfoviridis]|uniref:Zinc-finger domain-containing protein n=1 Tax=Blastochloris sulfoviridis TaxID=50712 RepID=A0A5M6I3Z5_9HYPH|nr:hypothetical protein [Blastochloris sulfoviridis]KAA5602892.1 hypothetical protein F1193_03395 [Blastochloris sulfoviridis]